MSGHDRLEAALRSKLSLGEWKAVQKGVADGPHERPAPLPIASRVWAAGSGGMGLAALAYAVLLAHTVAGGTWTVASSLSWGSVFLACLALVVCLIVVGGICDILPKAESALYKAVAAGDGQAVAALLQQGADPEHGDRTAVPLGGRFLVDNTPLRMAVGKGHTAIVKALLAAVARPDAGHALGPFGSVVSDTSLHMVASNGHSHTAIAIVQALLAAGARPDAGGTFGPFTFATPLTAAGNEEIKQALRAAGAGWPSFILENLRGIVSWGLVILIVALLNEAGRSSRWRHCHFADAFSPSRLMLHLLKAEGVQQNDSLVRG